MIICYFSVNFETDNSVSIRASTMLTDNSLPDPDTKLLPLSPPVPRTLPLPALLTAPLLKLKLLNSLSNKVSPELLNT